jgi:hypothetical protein
VMNLFSFGYITSSIPPRKVIQAASDGRSGKP